jgi:hypothetical protein
MQITVGRKLHLGSDSNMASTVAYCMAKIPKDISGSLVHLN